MSQAFAEALSWVPKSRGLAVTLARAFDYAKAQSHRAVMLEHLLLALAADADASVVLQACNVDLARLNDDVTSYLAGVDERLAPGEAADPAASPDLLRILEYASAAAQQGRRRDINGAIVLAAIVGDGRSPAASMLRAQGLTFEEAIKALQWASAAARAGAQQPPPSAAPGPAPAASSPQPVPTAPAASPHPVPPSAVPPAQEHRQQGDGHPPDPHRANGATRQSTEELLAEARRRVGTGREDFQQEPAAPPPPAASDLVRARAPRPQEPVRQHYPEPGHSGPQPGNGHEHQSGAGSEGELDVDEVAPAQPQRAPVVTPTRHVPPPANARQDGPDRQGAPVHRHPEAHPQDARHSLDWPAQQRPGGYHQPQQIREANRTHPAPPLPHPLRRQNPPHVHPVPPPPPRYQPPEPPQPMQAPWSGPPPHQPFPQAPGHGARRVASAAPLPEQRRIGVHGSEGPGSPLAAGQLVENIPRVMTVGLPETVEVRVAKAEIMALAEGLQGAGAAYRHDLIVTKAMSVRLRAPEGGFWIETASPETQWIENSLGLLSDDYASWRWTATPQRRGKARLQLVVSARTVGGDGLAAETALPDQVIEVKVRTNYGRTAAQWGGWLAAAVVGGMVAKFGEGLWDVGRSLLIQLGIV